MARKQPQQKDAHITVRVSHELSDRLQARADDDGVERSHLIRVLLDEGLRRRRASRDRLKQVLDEVKALRREVGEAVKKKGSRG